MKNSVLFVALILIAGSSCFAQSNCDYELDNLRRSNEQEIAQLRKKINSMGTPMVSGCTLAQKRAAQAMNIVALSTRCNSPQREQAVLMAKNLKQDADRYCDDTAISGMSQENESEFEKSLNAARQAEKERRTQVLIQQQQQQQQRERELAAQRQVEYEQRVAQEAAEEEESSDSYNSILEITGQALNARAERKASDRAYKARQAEINRARTATYSGSSGSSSTYNSGGCAGGSRIVTNGRGMKEVDC